MTGNVHSRYIDKEVVVFKRYLDVLHMRNEDRVPDDVYDKIRRQLEKHVTYARAIHAPTRESVRHVLRELRLARYLINMPELLNRLRGVTPLNLSAEVEADLITKYEKARCAYRHRYPGVSVPASFIAHKLLQTMEGQNANLAYFPLMNSIENRSRHERMWETMVAETTI